MIDQGELFEIPNPCRSICQVNSKGYCKGCFRSRQERFHWHSFSDYQKHLVVQLCAQREKRVIAAKLAQQDLYVKMEEAPSPQMAFFAEDENVNKAEPETVQSDDRRTKADAAKEIPVLEKPTKDQRNDNETYSKTLTKPAPSEPSKTSSDESQLDLF